MLMRLVGAVCLSVMTHAAHTAEFQELRDRGEAQSPSYGFKRLQDVERGQTVLGAGWIRERSYFENTLNWNNPAQFCDAMRTYEMNRHLHHLFTNESGCTNPGFRRLPAGVDWWIPSPPLNYKGVAPASGKMWVWAQTENYAGPMEVTLDTAHAHFVEEAQRTAPAGQTVAVLDTAQIARLEAPPPEEVRVPEPATPNVSVIANQPESVVEESTSNIPFWISLFAIIVGVVGLACAFLFRRLYQNESEERVILADTVRDLEKALEPVVIRLGIPYDMRPLGDTSLCRFIPVMEWAGKVGASDARVYLRGAEMQGKWIHYDEGKRIFDMSPILKHLNKHTDAARLSREQLRVICPPELAPHKDNESDIPTDATAGTSALQHS